jgi:pyridoxamine 5'-phosphate oxidase
MKNSLSLADIRKNYSREELTEQTVFQDPVQQFDFWLNEALKADVDEATAMVLSTATPDGKPSARVVLLKGIEDGSLIFFTNYLSRKGKQLEVNPFAALTFFWPELERQVRLEGKITRISEKASDIYFHSRPQASQIGAWASPQSQEVKDRTELEKAEIHYTQRFNASIEIPRPKHWGGFVFTPDYFEFWQGRPSRMHDRIIYEKQPNQAWAIKRLAP